MKMVKVKCLGLAVIAAGLLAGCAAGPVTTLPAGDYTYPTDTYYMHAPVTHIPAGTWHYPADTYRTDGGYSMPLCNSCGVNGGY